MNVALAETTQVANIPWWVFEALENDIENHSFLVTKGLGAGGTFGACIWHYVLCLLNNRSPISWAIAPTFQQIRDTLIPTFGQVLSGVFDLQESVDFDIVRSGTPRLVLRRTGQEVHFKSANRPERFVGPSISHYLMTEPGLIAQAAFEKADARLRCPKATRLQKMLEGTPEGTENHWAKIADIEPGLNIKRNATRTILWTSDNPHLNQGYLELLEQTYAYDPGKLESYLRGIFVPFVKGNAYWDFVHSRNVKLDVHTDKHVPIIMTWDFGVSPLVWVGLQRQPHERLGYRFHRFVALSEGSGKARGVLDACMEFVAQHDPKDFYDTPIEIDGGHDGYFGNMLAAGCAYDVIQRTLSKYYRSVRVTAARSAPEIRERLERVNALFAYEQFVVAAWCRNLIRSLTNSRLKEGQWTLEKKKGLDPTHFADAIGYPLFERTKTMNLDKPSDKKRRGTNL